MNLDDGQKRMYHGEYGPGMQKAIAMLVEYGDVFGSERMVKVHNAHVGLSPGDWVRQMVEGVDSIRAFTTTHAGMAGSNENGQAMGLKEEFCTQAKRNQDELLELCVPMGFIPSLTCAPYMVGNVPSPGRIFSWPGSQGIIVANSIFGARGNRDAMPASMASAITGLTPDMLLLRRENRYAQVVFEIEDLDTERFTPADYGAVGHFIGEVAGTRNVAVNGVSAAASFDDLKYFLSPMPVSGAVAMCHIVGVTPEAPIESEALGGGIPEDTVKVGRDEYRRGWDALHTAETDGVEMVIFGCPHLTIGELGELVRLLDGRRVSGNVRFIVTTAGPVRSLAEKTGYVAALERAGALVATDICIQGFPFPQMESPVKTVATNSGRAASYISRRGIGVQYGSMADCIEAAVSGRWRR